MCLSQWDNTVNDINSVACNSVDFLLLGDSDGAAYPKRGPIGEARSIIILFSIGGSWLSGKLKCFVCLKLLEIITAGSDFS